MPCSIGIALLPGVEGFTFVASQDEEETTRADASVIVSEIMTVEQNTLESLTNKLLLVVLCLTKLGKLTPFSPFFFFSTLTFVGLLLRKLRIVMNVVTQRGIPFEKSDIHEDLCDSSCRLVHETMVDA